MEVPQSSASLPSRFSPVLFFATLLFCHSVFCHPTFLPFCFLPLFFSAVFYFSSILLFYHSAFPPFCLSAILFLCHSTALSFCIHHSFIHFSISLFLIALFSSLISHSAPLKILNHYIFFHQFACIETMQNPLSSRSIGIRFIKGHVWLLLVILWMQCLTN